MLIEISKLGLAQTKGGGVPAGAMYRIRNGVKEYAVRNGAYAVRTN